MNVRHLCPDVSQLERLLQGRMAPGEVEAAVEHLEICPSCVDTVRGLQAEDTLLEGLRAGQPLPDVERDRVRDLIARLGRLSPAAAETTCDGEQGVTADPVAAPGAAPGAAGATVEDLLALLAPPQGPDELGRLGSYRVLRVLGAGGMGVVFLAEDPQLERRVALKVLRPALAASAAARQRFLQEARAAAALKHDHVITIHQVGEDRGVPFLAMELLEGEMLEDRLRREQRLPPEEVLRVGREVAEGLEAAHARGLIHRDVKPSNIWLEGQRGRVKLLDFGLVRASHGDVRLTEHGAILGTPGYMAPEQACGEPVDARTDLFGLGCVLYRLCTGRPAYPGKDVVSALVAVVSKQPPPPHEVDPQVPRALSDLVMRLLAREPAQRPPSAAAVAEALEDLQRAPAPALVPAVGSEGPRRRRGLLTAAVVLLALGSGAAYWLAGGVFRIDTGNGTLIVQTEADDVQVKVLQGGKEVAIVDPKTAKEITLRAGTYELELVGGKEGLVLVTNQFTLHRGGRRLVKVEFEPRAVAANPPPSPKGPPGASETPRKAAPLPTGEPLSPAALVRRPARLPGVKGWSLETVAPSQAVSACALSPDGRQLATLGREGVIRIWDTQGGQLVRVLLGHQVSKDSAPAALAWAPRGETLASTGGTDRTILFWEPHTGRLLRAQEVGSDIECLAWSPDGQKLAVGTSAALQVWDATAGKLLSPFPGARRTSRVAWSPDGKSLATAGHQNYPEGRAVSVWDLGSGKLHNRFQVHASKGIHNLSWSPDGKTLAVAIFETTIALWGAASGQLQKELDTPKGFSHYWDQVAWMPDGKSLAISCRSGEVTVPCLWEPDADRFTRKAWTSVQGDALGMALSADGKVLAAVYGEAIHCWETASWNPLLRTLSRFDNTASWSPSGGLLAVGGASNQGWSQSVGSVLVCDPVRGVPRDVAAVTGHQVWSLTWINGDKALLVADWHGTSVLARSGRDWSQRRLAVHIGRRGTHNRQTFTAAAGTVVALVPRTPQTAAAVWDAALGERVHQLDGHQTPVWTVALSPDGKTLATGTEKDGLIRLWDVASGMPLGQWACPKNAVVQLAWSPDGRALAVANMDGVVRLYQAASGTLLVNCEGHQISDGDRAFTMTWGPDGKTLGTADRDMVRYWDAASGKLLRSVPIAGAGFLAPDLRHVAVPTPQGVRLWETEKGQARGTLLLLDQKQYLVLGAEGHYRGSPGIEKEIVYVVQTGDRQETLTPEEFARRFGWTNDPERVRLTAE